jgi:hypothetical protein
VQEAGVAQGEGRFGLVHEFAVEPVISHGRVMVAD